MLCTILTFLVWFFFVQIQEIGDLQRAVRIKEDYRKLELRMKQKEKQYQDIISQKLQLQQQV